MTVYTLFLYLGIAGLVLTIVLGVVTNRLSKSENKQNLSVGNVFTWFLQYFMGSLLIFSGLVKAVDPLGTVYKMKEYFEVFAKQLSNPVIHAQMEGFMGKAAEQLSEPDQVAHFEVIATQLKTLAKELTQSNMSWMELMVEFMQNNVYTFSVFMLVLELVLGLYFILGFVGRYRSVLWVNLGMMGFFTFLTGFNYLTGYTPAGVTIFEFSEWIEFSDANIRMKDCGCFGDFMKLLPIETFMKDVILTGMGIILLVKAESMRSLAGKAKSVVLGTSLFTLFDVLIGAIAALVVNARDFKKVFSSARLRLIAFIIALDIIALCFCFMNYKWGLPMVDFRPFHENADVRAKKLECDNDKKETEMLFIYEDLKTKEILNIRSEEFTTTYDLAEKIVENGDTINRYKYVDRKDKVLHEGCTSIINEFGIDGDASSVHKAFIEVRENKDYHLMAVAVDLEKASPTALEKLNTLAKDVNQNNAAKFYGFYQIPLPNSTDPNTDASVKDVKWFQYDDKLLKTIIRANPGLVLMKDGKVVKKWHHTSIPTYDNLQQYLN